MILFSSQMIPQKAKRGNEISTAFDDEFSLEILKSDKLRVTILLAVISSAFVLLLTLAVFAYEQFQRTFHGVSIQ